MSDVLKAEVAVNAPPVKLKRILGLGVACVDIIACVEVYPEPDEKIRAESVQLFSGGNVGNTLTAIRKLGAVEASVFTKIGKDSNGDFVIDDLRKVGVDVKDVIISTTAPTLLVYVIVDKQARRTCIASPNEEELTPSEVNNKLCIKNLMGGTHESGDMLDNVQLVHLDSRHTEAAVVLAKEANRRNITVSLDVEKDRVFLSDLIPLCDIIFTNKEFPEVYFKNRTREGITLFLQKQHQGNMSDVNTEEEEGSEAFLTSLLCMSYLFNSLEGGSASSRAELVVTTRGAVGSLLMRRRGRKASKDEHTANLPDMSPCRRQKSESGRTFDSISENLLDKAPIAIHEYVLTRRCGGGHEEEIFDITRCAAWPCKPEDVVDSTGAGDAFIGGFISGWSEGYSDGNCMKLGTSVAAAKLAKKGAREGLPTSAELNRRLKSLIEK